MDRTHLNNPHVCDGGYFRTPTGSRFRVAPVRNRVGPPHAMAMSVYRPPLPHSTLRAPGRGGVQGARSDVWLFQSAPDSWLRSVPRTRGRGAALSGRGTTAAFGVERGTVGCSRTRGWRPPGRSRALAFRHFQWPLATANGDTSMYRGNLSLLHRFPSGTAPS